MKKKIASIVLAVALLMSILPLNAFAVSPQVRELRLDDIFIYEGQTNAIGKYDYCTYFSVEYEGDYSDSGTVYSQTYLNNHSFIFNDGQDQTPWTAGNTYEVKVTLNGFESSFNVEVRQAPDSISVEDAYTLKEDSVYSEPWFSEYKLNNFKVCYCVYDGDNSSTYSPGSSFQVSTYDYVYPDIFCSTPYENWVVGGTYECRIELMGLSDTFNVTVAEIKNVQIDDVLRIEEYKSWWNGYVTMSYEWDPQKEDYVDVEWFCYEVDPDNITVILKDETVISGNLWEIFKKFCLGIRFDSDQSVRNRWGIGNHTATLDFGGSQFNYTVKVVKSLIKSLEVADVEVEENTHGYEVENGKYIYSDLYSSWKVTLNNGTVLTVKDANYVEIGERTYNIEFDTSEQFDTPWTAGNTYEITASLLGVTTTFNVTVTECPVLSVEVADISVSEFTHGSYDGGVGGSWYHYSIEPETITVHLRDGSTVTGNSWEIYDQIGRLPEYDSDQCEENPWGIGEHTVSVTVGPVTTDYKFTVTESPVASVEISDLTLTQGLDSYYTGSYDHYDMFPIYTVTFKDGTKVTVDEDGYGSVYYGGEYYDLSIDYDQYENPLLPGNTYELTGKIGVVSDTFKVTVKENPVSRIEVIKAPDKTNLLISEVAVMNGLKIRVHYKDGAKEEFSVDRDYPVAGCFNIYSNKLKRDGNLYAQDEYYTSVGQKTLSFTLFGKTCEVPVTVKENTAKSLAVKETADRSLVLTVTKKDGSSEDWKVLSIPHHYDDGKTSEYIITDHGYFYMPRHQDENGSVFTMTLSVDEHTGRENTIKSNAIKNSKWLEASCALPILYNDTSADWVSDADKQHFTGTITAENIDGIISIVIASSGFAYNRNNILDSGNERDAETGRYKYYTVYSSDEVRKEVLKYLAINDLDLSLSKQYDPQKKTYTEWETAYIGIDSFPYLLEYKDGEWLGTYSCEYDNESHVFLVKLNDDNKITFIDNKLPDDPQPPVIVKQFSDVNYKDWYGDAVKFATSAGLIKGYANGRFGTADNIQRQDFVVILARLSGDDLSKYEGKTSFKDVAKGAYYEAALAWAKEKKVSSGYANGKFGVGDKITREQIMTFFYNYAKIKGIDVTVSDAEKAEIRAKYTDFKNVSGYAHEATYWALKNGVISGKQVNGKRYISPGTQAQRCEVAAMFYNIDQKGIFAK